MAVVNIRMKQRRKASADWTSSNEVLLDGEIGYETDTRKFKFGDGATAWNSLPYATPGGTSVALAAGSAGAPTLSFTSDADTGMWSPAADTIAWSTGGTERARIDSSGRFGVASISATADFQVGDLNAVNRSFRIGSNSNVSLDLSTNGSSGVNTISATNNAGGASSLAIVTASGGVEGERVRIDPTGKVGVGATNPQVLLDVNDDSVRIRTSASPASGATGVQGEICWDADYIYVCTATNTWKRAALTGGY